MQNYKETKKIAAAIIEKDGKILIAKRGKQDDNFGKWEFPGGKVEQGETLEQCLKRELMEELGISAEVGEYVTSSTFMHKDSLYEMCMFRVPSFDGVIQLHEHQEVKWVTRQDLPNYEYPDPDLPIVSMLVHCERKRNKMDDELLDIVDQNDQVIGQKWRSEVRAQKIYHFRAVNAFLMNAKGQLWIPRRTATKPIFPLCLDASMGGCVAAGETYDQAFARELMEELRIDANTHPFEYMGSLNPFVHGTSAFMKVYLLKTDMVPNYNPEDFNEYYWLTPKEVLERLRSGEKSKDDLPIMIEHIFQGD